MDTFFAPDGTVNKRENMQPNTSERGMTLIELMLVIAISAIVLTLVVPSAESIFAQQRIIAQLNHSSSTLQYARHQAVSRLQTTTMCPTTDFVSCQSDWTQAYMVFVDSNENGQRDSTETLLHSTSAAPFGLLISGPTAPVRFYFSGVSASPATLLFCDHSGDNRFARALFISMQGRISLSRDSNNDGLYETNSGTPLACAD
jgi:type IV fimbrial biogenesis protein FimT